MRNETTKQIETYLSQTSKIAPSQLKQIASTIGYLIENLRPATA
jgi:hypothetical protein